MALRGKNTIFGPFVTLFKAKSDRDKTPKVFSSEGLVTRDRTLGRFSTVMELLLSYYLGKGFQVKTLLFYLRYKPSYIL
jgi:hypothetical protein